jgi:uncharacterized protein (TIGR03083 family)
MDRDAKWQVIAGQRRVLADLLAGLDDDAWTRPSLCAQWRVKDVAAHVALAPQSPGILRILGKGLRAYGDLQAVNRDMALAHAARPTAELVAELQALADSRRKPAITTVDNLLFDTMVHIQDIAVPLGRTVAMPPDAAREGAERVWRMGWPFWARRRLRGLRLIAADVDWSAGDGAEVRGPVQALLLLLTGRTEAALPQLSGPGTKRLATTALADARHDEPPPARSSKTRGLDPTRHR